MKNLVAKAGVAAVTSVLLTSVLPAQEAKALSIKASNEAHIAKYNGSGATPEYHVHATGVVEVGEIFEEEIRGFAEFDLSSLASFTVSQREAAVLKFDIVELGGLEPSNQGNPFLGEIHVGAYFGNNFVDFSSPDVLDNPLLSDFDPDPTFDVTSFFITNFATGTVTLKIGDFISAFFDIATPPNMGFVLAASPFGEPNDLGSCGTTSSAREKCSGVVFDNFRIEAVPTPAAILPSLLGLGSAAFRKKREEEEES